MGFCQRTSSKHHLRKPTNIPCKFSIKVSSPGSEKAPGFLSAVRLLSLSAVLFIPELKEFATFR